MRLRIAALLLVLGVVGLVLWRAELFTVSRPGERPMPLSRIDPETIPAFDVSLPIVPVGVARLVPGREPLLVHYWAPWQHDSRAQITALDSLLSTLAPLHLRVAVVCFDPFPSVARYVARLHVSAPVLLDLHRRLQAALPCPSIPYTWLLDARGRVIARQAGEVDWLAPGTRDLLRAVAASDSGGLDSLPRVNAQARAVSVAGRAKMRDRAAYPPNSAAL